MKMYLCFRRSLISRCGAFCCPFGNSKITTSGDATARTVLAEAHKNLDASVDIGSTTAGSSDAHVEGDISLVSMVPLAGQWHQSDVLMEAAMATQRRPGPLSELTVDQVAAWAALTPLPSEVAQILRDHEISGDILVTLSHDDMTAMGIRKLGWRRQLELCRRELMDQFRTRQATIGIDTQSDLANPSTDCISAEQGAIGSSCVNPAPIVQHGMDYAPVRDPLNMSQLSMESTETLAETSEESSMKVGGAIQGPGSKAKAKGLGMSQPLSAVRITTPPMAESACYWIPYAIPPVVRRERSPSSFTGVITSIAQEIPIRGSSTAREKYNEIKTFLPLSASGTGRRACDSPQRNLHGIMRSPGAPKVAPVGKGASTTTPRLPVTPEKSRASWSTSASPVMRASATTITTKPRSATPDLPHAAKDASKSPNTAAVRNCTKSTVPRSRTATPDLPRAGTTNTQIYVPKPRAGTPGTSNSLFAARDNGTGITPRLGSGTPYLKRITQDGVTIVEPRQGPCTTELSRTAYAFMTVIPPSRHPKWDDRVQRKIVGRIPSQDRLTHHV